MFLSPLFWLGFVGGLPLGIVSGYGLTSIWIERALRKSKTRNNGKGRQ
jgi:membrane protein required for beta-lactamase induction